jgi:hypothetical protein
MLYNSLRDQKQTIIDCNPYNYRYGRNNDIFIHVRLSDATEFNPGVNYYLNAMECIVKNANTRVYIGTDEPNHPMISTILGKYPPNRAFILTLDYIKTIQFGSTCRNIILSHGSFSALIGYLGFFTENIYFSSFDGLKHWHGDIFSIPGWTMVERQP